MPKTFMKQYWLCSLPTSISSLMSLFSMLNSSSNTSEMYNSLKKYLKITFTLLLTTSTFSWIIFNSLSTMLNTKKIPKMPNKSTKTSSILLQLDSPEPSRILLKNIKQSKRSHSIISETTLQVFTQLKLHKKKSNKHKFISKITINL